jgi:hypothetical protein
VLFLIAWGLAAASLGLHLVSSPPTSNPWASVGAGLAALGVALHGGAAPASHPHTVGRWVLVVTLACTSLCGLIPELVDLSLPALVTQRTLIAPLTFVSLGLSFAFIGRQHRLRGGRRLANLADLVGITTPLLWAAHLMIASPPSPALWVPAVAAWALGGWAVMSLIPPAPAPPSDTR